MGFNVNLYTFSKELNSTARPTTNPVAYSCVIKEPCSMLNPIIGLDIGLTTSPSNFNYAYISTFGRYYFIKEWTFQNALWYASLEVDPLASWKTQIGTSTCYVTRSSSESNGAIMDTTYPVTSNTTLQESIKDSPWDVDITDGNFVVGITGQETTYYLFSYGYLQMFFDTLFSDDYCAAIYGAEWLSAYPQLKSQTNPLQYITSLIHIPNNYTGGATVTSVRVGWVDIVTVARKVDGDATISGVIDWTLLRHPQAATRGSFLNSSPFSYYTLFFPPFGTVALDADVCANSTKIYGIWSVDLRTGSATLKVVAGDAHILSLLHAQVGIQYQVSQVVNRGYGWSQAFTAIPNAIGQAVSGNVGGLVNIATSEIGTFANSKVPSAHTIGNNGGGNSLKGAPTLIYEFKELVNEDNTNRGRPLCANRVINTLSGFIKVASAYIDLPCTQAERQTINEYMEGGFFYE